MINKLRRIFFGETYQEILDRKYGGSIPTNMLVNDRELSNAGKRKLIRSITSTPTSNGNSFYNAFYPHYLNKHHFRKKKITKMFSL